MHPRDRVHRLGVAGIRPRAVRRRARRPLQVRRRVDARLEWTLASYGISAAGGVVVPVYPTNSPKECAWVAGNSEARAVIVENATQMAKLDEIRSELPH